MAKRVLLILVSSLVAAVMVAESRQAPDADLERFVLTAWQSRKEVSQLWWIPAISKPTVRLDLRQELAISASLRSGDLRSKNDLVRSGDLSIKGDLVLFARVLEGAKVISPIHSVTTTLLPLTVQGPSNRAWLAMKAIVRPGKYRVELALLDRETHRYNTWFKDVTIKGSNSLPLERAFQKFSKFEFIPEWDPEKRIANTSPLVLTLTTDVVPGVGYVQRAVFTPSDVGSSDRSPFPIDRPGTLHLSVITILDPPESTSDAQMVELFRNNLSHLLAAFTRLEVHRGTAQLTGLDLARRTRVFDRVNMRGITPSTLDKAIRTETQTVTLDNLVADPRRGRFLREVLKERLEEAEKDTSGAEHAIVVVSASATFAGASGLAIPATRDCHCRVYYVRFGLVPHSPDDIDDMLKAYRPRVFEPLTWADFREDFGKIYDQLLR